MEGWTAVCRECDWIQPMPRQSMAEHAKRVHEDRYAHRVVLEPPDASPK